MPGVTYDVPLVLPGLRKEESVLQMVNALEYLQKVSTDVFTKIEKRVEECRDNISGIDKRVNVAQARIDKIRGSRKAIRVFSSAKYPAPEKLQHYTSLHTCDGLHANPIPEIDCNYHVVSKFPKVDNDSIKDKLQFYNVQLNATNKKGDHADQGLGGLPKEIQSVSSLLLFNTTENPYKKYVILDPLEGAITKTRKGLEEEENDLAAAPVTITNREQMELLGLTNYFYVPNLGDVPELDVPVHLPDLPGIADDLAWSADLGPSIAPSVAGSNVPELPEIVPDEPAPSPSLLPEETTINNGPVIQGSTAVHPPPPPPPGPPPPPVPVEENTTARPGHEEAPSDEANEDTAGGDGRADLMAAIRNAGGAGKAVLKSGKERKQRKKAEKEKTSGGGGDLMSDLFSKLQMRRKGISGARGDRSDETGGGSAMDKVSSMIPPPNVSSSLGNDGGDWDE